MDYTSRVFWHEANGKKVLVADYSDLTGEDLMGVFNHSYTTQKGAGTDVLLLTDFSRAKANNEIVSALKKAGKELDQDMKKVAAVGLTSFQKIFYNGYIRVTGQAHKTKLFDTRDQAFDWLLTD
jgi:hypothetical protein